MNKIAIVTLVAFSSIPLLAQAPAKKPAHATARPASGPTKVTGEGVKTPSGLQYWDIRPGTGT
jgi:hypothetical protein